MTRHTQPLSLSNSLPSLVAQQLVASLAGFVAVLMAESFPAVARLAERQPYVSDIIWPTSIEALLGFVITRRWPHAYREGLLVWILPNGALMIAVAYRLSRVPWFVIKHDFFDFEKGAEGLTGYVMTEPALCSVGFVIGVAIAMVVKNYPQRVS